MPWRPIFQLVDHRTHCLRHEPARVQAELGGDSDQFGVGEHRGDHHDRHGEAGGQVVAPGVPGVVAQEPLYDPQGERVKG